ncbi:hypothetical protein L6R52_37365 [Myxococcota bacterium]|nr:hypothetical protein [Myxococcota bacterium]
MRIAFFHNWSWLGAALAGALIDARQDELWIVGAPVPKGERDPELYERAKKGRALAVAPRDVAHPVFLRRLATFAPDLVVVGTFPKKLPPELLAIPKLAAINVHASLLPRYRGALPEFWVIRDGEPESGLSVHHMTDALDEGRVLAQARFPLSMDETLLSLSAKLTREGPGLLLGVLDRYRRGERPEGEEQDHAKASKAPAVKEHHLEVRWTEGARSIERLVRAAYPVFDPFTHLAGERLVLRRVRVRASPHVLPVRNADTSVRRFLRAGELHVDRERSRLVVGTGEGALDLLGLELDGEAMSGYELARRRALEGGELLT